MYYDDSYYLAILNAFEQRAILLLFYCHDYLPRSFFNVSCDFITARVGIPDCAPFFVIDSEPTKFAKQTLSINISPLARLKAGVPLNASPAQVVSKISATSTAGTSWITSPLLKTAPLEPKVIINLLRYRFNPSSIFSPGNKL